VDWIDLAEDWQAGSSEHCNEISVVICAVVGYNAASNGNPLPTFRKNESVPSSRILDFLTLEDGSDTLP
jgi:hypothetical protein